MISTAIFDVDGTLIDSVDAHARAWQEALEKFGHRVAFADVRSQIGKGGDQLLPVFLSDKDLAMQSKALNEYRDELFKKSGFPTVRAFPGVRALFKALHARGIRLVLASSASKDDLEAYQRLADIEDLVDAATSKSDVEHSKPAPDIFAVALKGSGPAKQARVIGDSPFDMEAARKVGIPSIGVRSGGFPEADLRAAGCIAVYSDPEELLARIDEWTA